MPNYRMIALTRPVPGREAEFHDWYQNKHLPELCALPGMVGAQRYQLVAALAGNADNPWLAIYDLTCDDPMAFLGKLGEMSASGQLTPSDASDGQYTYTALFSEYGERVGDTA